MRLSNDKIKEAITNVEQSRFLLELVGFEEVMVPSELEGNLEMYLMMDKSRIDARDINHLISILEEILANRSMKPLTDRLGIKLPENKTQ